MAIITTNAVFLYHIRVFAHFFHSNMCITNRYTITLFSLQVSDSQTRPPSDNGNRYRRLHDVDGGQWLRRVGHYDDRLGGGRAGSGPTVASTGLLCQGHGAGYCRPHQQR